MKSTWILLLLTTFTLKSIGQIVVSPKGTKYTIDSSKWKISGNDIYNKNIGKIGIGTANPTAQFHTKGSIRFEGLETNTANTKVLTADAEGNITSQLISQGTSMLDEFSATAKGVVPASGGGTTNFLRADGVFAAPPENFSRALITLTSDVTNNNATANTLQDVTGLSFNVLAGIFYRFYAMIPYNSEQVNNGSRWTITTPTTSFISYVSRYTDNPETVNYCNANNLPTSCTNSSNLTGNIAVIQGIIKPSVNGTVQIRFASKNSNKAIVAKAGGTLEYW